MVFMENTDTAEGSFHILVEGTSWPADVEAQGASHIRVRFADVAGPPSLAPGQVITCKFDKGTHSAFIQGIALNCAKGSAWIRLLGAWTSWERRAGHRGKGGFPIRLRFTDVEYKGTSVDISPGGMRVHLERPNNHPRRLSVTFSLPGNTNEWTLNARIVHSEEIEADAGAIEWGLKFTGLPPEIGARIADFCKED